MLYATIHCVVVSSMDYKKIKVMKVLFEVERFNDPNIDSKLLDVLFYIKSNLINKLSPLIEEIDSVEGEMVIVFTPTVGGFRAIGMEMDLMMKIEN